MNIVALDIIIAVIVAASAIWGLVKGFVRQFVSIAALLLGLWCGFRFTEPLSDYVKDLFSLSIQQDALHAAIFITIFIATLLFAHLAGKAIEGFLKLTMLGWLNRIAGMVFGALKVVIILGVAAHVVKYLNSTLQIIPQDFFSNSKLYGLIEEFSEKVFPYLHNIFS